ncbi:MAG: aminotransferase class I/II-fold pyridoxal phosphate-dependent enzyme [Firmicutes bacterium]|nr:aminotransferase class I/II-fold pyridoxal phosphate-dependent enzyme [Bacillota bacterium]
MQAMILAAGMGKRLKELTNENTKCMVEVNGVTIIERMLRQLDKLGLSRIIIVVGYKASALAEHIEELQIKTPITYVKNEIYDKTNNIYSLYLAREYLLEEDTLLIESDLVFEDAVLQRILADPYPDLALVAKYESWMDGTVVTIDENRNIRSILDKRQFRFEDVHEYYKTVNIYRFSKEFADSSYVPFLEAFIKAAGSNEYYEQVLKVIVLVGKSAIKASVLEGEQWYEIDDAQDLDIAESIFALSPEDKLKRFQSRYGGYWRYPQMIDFCYLVNPFYPPKKLLDEIKSNFERLVTAYPSGMRVNSLLAAKFFGLRPEFMAIGNGATELIKSLMERLPGKVGIIRPTFEEYPNRKSKDDVVVYLAEKRDYSYTADDLMEYFDDQDISSLILINPDNPSGNYIQKKDVLRLASWAQNRNTFFIVDESFVDFADEDEATLLNEEVLRSRHNLAVVKSISKSYGVPGLRLGVLATANVELASLVKKDVAIWNINSIAEFYLQICEKYKEDYEEAIRRFKAVRKEFVDALSSIDNLRIIPTQANFVMCEVLGAHTARHVAALLLHRFGILVRNLSSKRGITGEYIRVAVKRPDENQRLVDALRVVLNGSGV